MTPTSPDAHNAIAIVIPVYNRQDLVMRTLNSIAAQTVAPAQVILVDNNSTDDTATVLEKWRGQVQSLGLNVTVKKCDTRGAAAARNCGLADVHTPWVMFFDSDDTMAPTHVERVMRGVDQNSDAQILGWDVMAHYPGGVTRRRPFYDTDMQYHSLMHGSMATLRYAVRTDVVRRCGAWDENDRGWDDIEMAARMIPHIDKAVKLSGKPTVDVYFSNESITGTAYSKGASRFEHSIDSIQQSLPSDCRHWADLKRIILAACYEKEGAHDHAHRLRHVALSATAPATRRLLYKFAYTYTRLGGRGIARILRPFI